MTWGSRGVEGEASLQAWDTRLRASFLGSALILGACGPKEATSVAKTGWTEPGWSLTGRPGKLKPGRPTSPLAPVEGPRCWAPTAKLQDKQESPWGRKWKNWKGSQESEGGSQGTSVPYLLSFGALDARVSLQGAKVYGLRLGMLGHPKLPSHM